MTIGCVILAGGKSSRMGTDKALLEINGKKFIRRIAEELDFFEEKLIARGKNRATPIDGWNVIPDIYPECGPVGGLHAALTACESDALFCVSCDMPLIRRELVEELCEQMSAGQAQGLCGQMNDGQAQGLFEQITEAFDAVIVRDESGRAHPTCGVYRKSAVPVFEQQILAGNYRVMRALEHLRIRYVTVALENGGEQLRNINTPEDYRELEMWKTEENLKKILGQMKN